MVHRTPVLTSGQLDRAAGAQVFAKCESLQRTGSFKFRGASNAVRSLARPTPVACHSSGNHGAALALAAREQGAVAHVVMPTTAPAVKRAAVTGYGGRVVDCEPTLAARQATLARVVAETGAVEVHPYDDDRVIAGQGTAALELLEEVPGLDALVAPVGGGGLLSGTARAVAAAGSSATVVGAEPSGADDARRSLAGGALVPAVAPDTVADGLLTSLSERTFAVISARVAAIVAVDDHATVDALRWVWERMKLVVEPSAAVAVAAVLARSVPGERIGVILSGGNVDLDRLPTLVSPTARPGG